MKEVVPGYNNAREVVCRNNAEEINTRYKSMKEVKKSFSIAVREKAEGD